MNCYKNYVEIIFIIKLIYFVNISSYYELDFKKTYFKISFEIYVLAINKQL